MPAFQLFEYYGLAVFKSALLLVVAHTVPDFK